MVLQLGQRGARLVERSSAGATSLCVRVCGSNSIKRQRDGLPPSGAACTGRSGGNKTAARRMHRTTAPIVRCRLVVCESASGAGQRRSLLLRQRRPTRRPLCCATGGPMFGQRARLRAPPLRAHRLAGWLLACGATERRRPGQRAGWSELPARRRRRHSAAIGMRPFSRRTLAAHRQPSCASRCRRSTTGICSAVVVRCPRPYYATTGRRRANTSAACWLLSLAILLVRLV